MFLSNRALIGLQSVYFRCPYFGFYHGNTCQGPALLNAADANRKKQNELRFQHRKTPPCFHVVLPFASEPYYRPGHRLHDKSHAPGRVIGYQQVQRAQHEPQAREASMHPALFLFSSNHHSNHT